MPRGRPKGSKNKKKTSRKKTSRKKTTRKKTTRKKKKGYQQTIRRKNYKKPINIEIDPPGANNKTVIKIKSIKK